LFQGNFKGFIAKLLGRTWEAKGDVVAEVRFIAMLFAIAA
jgi:hypothetical protein